MILKKNRSIFLVLTLVLLLAYTVPIQTFALSYADLNFGEGIVDSTNGTVTMTVSWPDLGGNFDPHTESKTFTVTNNSGKKVQINFNYSTTYSGMANDTSCTFSDNVTSTPSTGAVTLDAGGSFTVTVTVNGYDSDANSGSVILSGIDVTEVTAKTVKIVYDSSKGSVTGYPTGTDVEIPSAGLALTAVKNSNATFLGWTDQNGKRLSPDASYTASATAELTEIHAIFATTSPWFEVNGTHLFEGLSTAVSKGTKVVLANNATLPEGDYTIPSGVTVLIPHDAAYTINSDNLPTVKSVAIQDWTDPTAFRTLKMAANAKITVASGGNLLISGSQNSKQCSNGCPVGPLGMIQMAGSSSITVASGGKLYVWGYIYRESASSEGTVTVQSGGTVYECFQIMDWRGGSATLPIKSNAEDDYTKEESGEGWGVPESRHTFPISQYYVQNVQVPLTLNSGAQEKVVFTIEASDLVRTVVVDFIGSNNGMFRNGSGTVTKDYAEATDRLEVSVTGTITLANLVLQVPLIGSELYTVDSAHYALPINGCFTVTLESGSTVDITGQDMCLLPGAIVHIKPTASLMVGTGTELYIYDASEWGKYCYPSAEFVPVKYAAGDGINIRRNATTEDAKIIVEGTLTATSGYLFTTESGASIVGTNDHVGTVNIKPKTIRKTYINHYIKWYGPIPQERTETVTLSYASKQVTQSGTDISYQDVRINPAWLRNGDGNYAAFSQNKTESSAAYTATYAHGVWYEGQHTVSQTGENPPTCTTDGYTSYKCVCGYTYNTPIGKLGHDWGTPTYAWTENNTKYTASVTCSRGCTDSETVSVTEVTSKRQNATCSAAGLAYYTADFTKDWATDQEPTLPIPIDPNAHSWNTDKNTWTYTWDENYAKCTAERRCKLNAEHIDSVETTNITSTTTATCTAAGTTTYTATFPAGSWATTQTKTVDTAALGHLWFNEDGSFVDGTCLRENCEEPAIRCTGILLDVKSEIQLVLKYSIVDEFLSKLDTDGSSLLKVTVTEEENLIEVAFNETYSVSKLEKDDDGVRYVVKQGIASGEMTGLVTNQFTMNGKVVKVYDKYQDEMVDTIEKTVLDYIKQAKLAYDKDQTKYENLWQMCRWAVTYGGHAQKFYFDGTEKANEAELAYRILNELDSSIPTSTKDGSDGTKKLADYKRQVKAGETYSGPTASGQRLNLDSKVYLRTYFTPPTGMTAEDVRNSANLTVQLTRPIQNGNNTETVNISWATDQNGRLHLDINDIPPAYWNDTFTITITQKDDGGNVVGTYTLYTSPMTWCNSCVAAAKTSTPKLKAQYDMALTMYDYAKAADKYFQTGDASSTPVSE